MSVRISKYEFEGPYSSTTSLQNRAGVYVIIDDKGNGMSLVDVGESSDVKSRVENHDRKGCWDRNSIGTLKVAVLYTPGLDQSGRMAIEEEVRNQYHPACGVR